jgi:hypothetical protein
MITEQQIISKNQTLPKNITISTLSTQNKERIMKAEQQKKPSHI